MRFHIYFPQNSWNFHKILLLVRILNRLHDRQRSLNGLHFIQEVARYKISEGLLCMNIMYIILQSEYIQRVFNDMQTQKVFYK